MGIFDRLFGRVSEDATEDDSSKPVPATLERVVDAEASELRYRPHGLHGLASAAELSIRQRVVFDVLENLVLDGDASMVDGEVILPMAKLAELDGADLDVLGLSRATGWRVQVRVGGVIGKRQPDIKLRWTSPGGEYGVVSRGEFKLAPCGFFHPGTEELVVLPEELLRLRETVSGAPDGFDQQADEFRFLAHVRAAATAAQEVGHFVEVDGQLAVEEYVAPETVEIDLRQNDDGSVDIRPIVDGWGSFDEADSLANAASTKRVFKVQRDGRTTRVALDEKVGREVNRVRQRSHIPREKVREFVANPRSFLQPPEEIAEERERRARALGVDVAELPEEDDGDTLDLSAVIERIGELRIEDYGDRVVGFSHIVEETAGPRKATSLDDWKGEAPEEPDLEQPWEHDLDEDIPVEEDDKPKTRLHLVTASNDEEVEYEQQLSLALREEFAKLDAPSLFSGKFYPHQEQGYVWLRNLNDPGTEAGGLLADDMGLGKTIQVIALFAHLKAQESLGPSLLVVPKSTIVNWKREIRKFCAAPLEIYEHRGPQRLKNSARIAEQDIVITTYSTLNTDQIVLGRVGFQVMVCDEAQYIKNYTTSRAQACRAMSARLRIALTATPVENQLDELWSIVDFSQPGLLGSLQEFRERFAKPIESGSPEVSSARAIALLQRMHGHYLRRTKERHLADQLPVKYIHPAMVDMTEVQLEWYEKIRGWYHLNPGLGTALIAIQNLLRVCTHPYAPSAESLARFGLRAPEFGDALAEPEKLWAMSGKMLFVKRRLDEIRDLEEKVILFCTAKRVQQILQQCVRHAYAIKPDIINGEVEGSQRQTRIDEFNDRPGFGVIIMSPLAAGVGVNVTGANHVIHVMREWNPAKENQATDRAYRIGQKKDVHVHVPIARHPTVASLDVRLNELIQAKSEIAQNVLRPASAAVKTEDLQGALYE